MVESKMDDDEKESRRFKPIEHLMSRMKEMECKSSYGAKVASKWHDIVKWSLKTRVYPVIHPVGQETFSVYVHFPTGVFEYALDIDGATALINEKRMKPNMFKPSKIIAAVDQGNLNKDTSSITTNHKNPIMVLQSHYLTDDNFYCINGNHRINEAYKNNTEQIEVYIFNDLEFMPVFYNMLSKVVYLLEIDYNHVITNESCNLKREYAAAYLKNKGQERVQWKE